MKHRRYNYNYPPWVGSQYGSGENIKLLVVGKSYFDARYRDKTIDSFISDLIKGRSKDSFYSTLELVLAEGRHWKKGLGGKMSLDRKKFWNGLCFHQFIQAILSDGYTAPGKAMWKEGQEIFKEILLALQPQLVIMAGEEIFNHMPTLGGATGKTYSEGREKMKTWILNSGEAECRIAAIRNPRDGTFDTRTWKSLYQQFLSDYRNDHGLAGFSIS